MMWLETAMTSGVAVIADVALKGAVILTFAALLALALKRSSAALRHLVWSTALVGLLALPLLSAIVPDWQVPVIQSVMRAVPTGATAPVATSRGSVIPTPAPTPVDERTATPAAGQAVVPRWIGPEPPNPDPSGARAGGSIAPTEALTPTESGVPFTALIGALSLSTWLFLAWLAGVVAVLAWVVLGTVATWWLARSIYEVTSGPLLELVDQTAKELGIRAPVTLLLSESTSMPRTWGVRPKLLLPASASQWSDQRLRAVLLHELAHIKRHDYVTQLLGRVAGAIHWFNPLVWYATHRMRVERERACDDCVLSTGSRASDYAQHLLDIAHSMKAGRLSSATTIAMARRSHLSDRLLDVLDATRRRTAVSPKMASLVWTMTALVVLPVAGMGTSSAPEKVDSEQPATETTSTEFIGGRTVDPHTDTRIEATPHYSRPFASRPQSTCDWYRNDENTSTSIQSNDEELRIRIKKEDCQLRIEAYGEIEFNDSETDVAYLSRDGSFEIEERDGRNRLRLEIDTDRDGTIRHRWFVDGDEQEFDAAAQDWFAYLLPLVFRRAGFNAEERAARILEQQGVDGVLQEISYIPSDYVARKYFQVVLSQADLDETQLRRIVRQAGQELDSDYELAELLIEVAESHPIDRSAQVAYVEAVGYIDSDYEKRRSLNAVLDRPGLDQEAAQAMLQLALDIDSDYELAELLIAMMERHPIDQTLTPEFFQAIDKLDSDYEHRRVLNVALERGAPSQEVLDLALASAGRLDSDYELAELLIRVASLYPTDREIPYSYLNAATSLDSDYERKRVMSVLIERGELTDAALTEVLGVMQQMDSDYELAETLISVNHSYELTPSTHQPFFASVDRLDSDHDRARVLQAVLEQQRLDDALIEGILGASSDLDSDYERANVLIAVAESHRLSEQLRETYIDVANGISSRYERDRVLAALVRGGGGR
jgi:beta-lactamase regulating signal transducer with metallopeptidase domain